MFKLPLLWLGLLLNCSLLAQHNWTDTGGARIAAVANSNLIYQDIHSLFSNPAGLAYMENWAFHLFNHNRYLLPELNTYAIGIALPTTSGSFGFSALHFGFEVYKEQKIGLSYGRKIGEHLALGVQFDILSTRIKEHGKDNTFTFELGIQYQLSKELWAGVHVFNPIRSQLFSAPLPSILNIGFNYQPADYLVISTALAQNSQQGFSLKIGLEYLMMERLYFRCGWQSTPANFRIGLGYVFKNILVNMAMGYHPILGLSPSFGLSFAGDRREKVSQKKF